MTFLDVLGTRVGLTKAYNGKIFPRHYGEPHRFLCMSYNLSLVIHFGVKYIVVFFLVNMPPFCPLCITVSMRGFGEIFWGHIPN